MIKYLHPLLVNDDRRQPHMDAAPNAFFSRQLEEIRAGVMEVQYAALKGMQLVPMRGGLNPGAAEFTNRVFDKTGEAELLATGQSRSKRADVFGVESTIRYRRFGASYAFDKEEVRNAAFAGTDLPQRKANAARWALALKHDNAVLLGSAGPGDLSTTGFVGLFTASNTCTQTPSTGSNGTLFSGKTPDEIVNDLIQMENQIITTTLEVEVPDTLVLPLSVRPQMQSRMGDGSDVTILRHYLNNTDNIKTVIYSQKLNSNAAWTGARAVMYKRDPDKIEGITSIEFSQDPPQYVGWETVTECEMKTAGCFVYLPKSICYMDNI
jgi:hypothetical protein